jgi:2-phospho-L-lactate/phosphoenolpyruvate guanylyltransferase
MNVALLPAKALPLAKTRLASLLTPTDRAAVSRAMFRDVLTALRRASCLDAVLVVTSDPVLSGDARGAGALVCAEETPRGLNGAVVLGTNAALELGATAVLVVLSDIPLLTATDVEEICASAPARGGLVVPSKEGTFTNAMFRRPPALFPPCFGRRSLARHVAAAERHGLPCPILSSRRVGFDVDTPDDLRAFASAESRTATYAEALRLGLTPLRPVA